MIFASAEAMAASLSPAELARGDLYPDLARIREVSTKVAAGVLKAAHTDGVLRAEVPGLNTPTGDDSDVVEWVESSMYDAFAPMMFRGGIEAHN